jgi:hypothetical protein
MAARQCGLKSGEARPHTLFFDVCRLSQQYAKLGF